MNRLEKKCLIVSTGIHLLLVAILVICPGFLSSKDQPQPAQFLQFIPLKTTDLNASGGGNPNARPPASPPAPKPQPTPPAPPPPAPAQREPEPDRDRLPK